MTAPAEFEDLSRRDDLYGSVDLLQVDRRWLDDSEWVACRERLDRRLFSTWLERPDALVVRRLVLYDLRSFEGGSAERHQRLTSAHRAWVGGLVRDLHYLGAVSPVWTGHVDRLARTGAKAPVRYELRQLIVGRAGSDDELPADAVGTPTEPGWTGTFDPLWDRAIEHNPPPSATAGGPRADRDPRLHLGGRR